LELTASGYRGLDEDGAVEGTSSTTAENALATSGIVRVQELATINAHETNPARARTIDIECASPIWLAKLVDAGRLLRRRRRVVREEPPITTTLPYLHVIFTTASSTCFFLQQF
jgi:hypothetical protein